MILVFILFFFKSARIFKLLLLHCCTILLIVAFYNEAVNKNIVNTHKKKNYVQWRHNFEYNQGTDIRLLYIPKKLKIVIKTSPRTKPVF